MIIATQSQTKPNRRERTVRIAYQMKKLANTAVSAALAGSAVTQIAQYARPRLCRFAIARDNRQDFFAPIAHRADDHQESGFLLLKTGFDVDPVRPGVDELAVIQSSAAPGVVFDDPLLTQTSDRGRRQRRSLAQQAAQRQLEVVLRQTVQVKLWQQLTCFLGAPGEQRQYRTLKSLFQTPHPRAFHLDRARGQGQSPPLPVPIAVAAGCVQRCLSLVP